jgi:2,3-bisphosphoglycerate-independent phosphoglycerate mutase
MSAPEVTEALASAIDSGEADVYIVNFANGDMVGHTGKMDAAIKAVEAVDKGLKRVVDAVCSAGGFALITADHGNCEQMEDPDNPGQPWTAHTTNVVPFVLVDPDNSDMHLSFEHGDGRLADIAPTLVDLMGMPKPDEWTGRSLISRA